MASTDVDGTKLMIIGEGQPLTLVMGDRSYQGTLRLRADGFQENWYIEMPRISGSDIYEIEIHKRERPKETCGLKSLHPAHDNCPGTEHLAEK